MAAWVGYGNVAVSDSSLCRANFAPGLGSGGGREKSLEVLRSLPVGEFVFTFIADIMLNDVSGQLGILLVIQVGMLVCTIYWILWLCDLNYSNV